MIKQIYTTGQAIQNELNRLYPKEHENFEDIFVLHEQNMEKYKKSAVFVCGKPLQVGVVYSVDSVERGGKCYHNNIGVITKINNTTVNICFEDGALHRVAIKDLKYIIGTEDFDLGCWGAERHQLRVKPFIKKTLKNLNLILNI